MVYGFIIPQNAIFILTDLLLSQIL